MAEQNLAAETAKHVAPYFDVIFSRLSDNEQATTAAFGRHVHWGYWSDPASADGTPEDYGRAAEQLCRKICDASGIRDGQRILDVGCGFGGTIASLNERFADLELVGVNIDPRQLDRARATIQPANGNRIRFVEADACQLPFSDRSFDVVLAVECIFHFGNRAAFFAEACRVLEPGGTLAFSDFVPPERAVPLLQYFNTSTDDATLRTYGRIDVLWSLKKYLGMAEATGLALLGEENINAHTLPTYPFLRRQLQSWDDPANASVFDLATAQIETACRAGMLCYTILSFQKPIPQTQRQTA